MVYGEAGRYSLSINAKAKTVRYCLRMQNMEEKRLPKMAYKMTLNSTEANNWASRMRNVLFECSYDGVWEHQSVADEREFLKSLRNKLIENINKQ